MWVCLAPCACLLHVRVAPPVISTPHVCMLPLCLRPCFLHVWAFSTCVCRPHVCAHALSMCVSVPSLCVCHVLFMCVRPCPVHVCGHAVSMCACPLREHMPPPVFTPSPRVFPRLANVCVPPPYWCPCLIHVYVPSRGFHVSQSIRSQSIRSQSQLIRTNR